MASYLLSASMLLGAVAAQSVDPAVPEIHPSLITYRCTKAGGCTPRTNKVVIDSSNHPIRQKDNPSLGCGDWGSAPNATVCPDEATCAENCLISGISNLAPYGVTTSGSSLRLDMLKDSDLSSLSPRVYLLREDEREYEMLQLTGKEFTFDVDMAKLPCGMNSALYLSEMEADGGRSELNPGGATYGQGYCDAQCYTFPFANGVGNVEGKGVCCNEMDIWEANSRATHLAPHPCNISGLYLGNEEESAFEGVCDKNGCSINPYRQGDKDYYGRGKEVDSLKRLTVVTQFPANSDGSLAGYRRLYIQDGQIIKSDSNIPNIDYFDDPYCASSGAERYMDLGGTEEMGDALSRGMVLALSIWWDEGGYMKWLDGEPAGPCTGSEGAPSNIRVVQPDTEVTFANIKWGEFDSTYTLKATPKPPVCNADNCLRALRANTIPGRLQEAQKFCATYTAAAASATNAALPKYAADGCKNDAGRVSSACSCLPKPTSA